MRWRALNSLLAVLALTVAAFADSQSKPADAPNPAPTPITPETRMLLIRSLNAEIVFAHHLLPRGEKPVRVKEGKIISPSEDEIARLAATNGPAAKPGDRAQITNIDIKSDRIYLQINGGPKHKKRWYDHVEVGVGGMSSKQAQTQDPSKPAPLGCVIILEFSTKFVPDMTGDQARALLEPVLDFHAKSAAEAYLETVPPKVKEAIKEHQVLVGMNREMVGYAKGRPAKKLREQDESGREYEEWIYGAPPKEVEFVRFIGDEVTRFERMMVDGQKVVRTEKEVEIVAAKKEEPEKPKPAAPAKRPSLRLPGEEQPDQQPQN